MSEVHIRNRHQYFTARLWREYSCFVCTQAHPSHAFEAKFVSNIMCTNKKASFALWLTVWFSFERRKIFLETVRQMLICFCHFSCSSAVTPSRRCFEACSVGVVSKFRCFFPGVFVSSHANCYNTIQKRHLDHFVKIPAYIFYIVFGCIKRAIISK